MRVFCTFICTNFKPCCPFTLHRSPAVGDFYGTGIKVWAGFGLIGSTEKKPD